VGERGVPLLAGSDAVNLLVFPGSGLHDELGYLVLLDANPLDDVSNTQKIRAVMARGRLFDRMALDNLLQGAALSAR